MTKFESAQAPKNQSDPNHAPQLETHPERVPTTLGGTTPANEDWEPQKINQEPKNRNKLATGIVIGSISTLAAAALGGWLYIRGASNDFETAMTGGDKGNTAEPFPGTDIDRNPGQLEVAPTLDSATPEQFYNDKYFTDEQRVKWASERLQGPSTDPEYLNMTVEQAAYNRLQSKLANQGRPQLGPLVEPSIENSANESNVLEIVAQAAAFYIGDPIAGEKILAAATDNNSDIIAKMRSGVIERYNLSEAERLDTSFQVTFTPNDAAKSQEAGHSIEMVSPYSTEAPIGNIIPEANTPTRVAYQRDSRNTGERFEELQTFKGGRWIASESILPSETNKWIEPTNLVDIMIK